MKDSDRHIAEFATILLYGVLLMAACVSYVYAHGKRISATTSAAAEMAAPAAHR